MKFTHKQRILFFLATSTMVAVALNPFKSFPGLPAEYFSANGVYPWAVLFMCAFFLFTMRRRIQVADTSPVFAAAGVAVTIGAFFLPGLAPEFMIFRLLLTWVGMGFVFFGRAASLPALLLCIYGFGIAFPKLVDAYAGLQYARATTWIVYNVAKNFIPITTGGNAISMTTLAGDRLVVIIDTACSGAASLSVFLSMFALISLDVPLPGKKWIPLLLFGITGTVVQNIFRLAFLLFAGFNFGPSAVKGWESISGYVIFPIWYAFFAVAYLRCAIHHDNNNINYDE